MDTQICSKLRAGLLAGFCAFLMLTVGCGGSKKTTNNGTKDATSDQSGSQSDADALLDSSVGDTLAGDSQVEDTGDPDLSEDDGVVSCESLKIGEGGDLPTSPDPKVTGDKQLLNYKYKGENRPYILHLPKGYDGSTALPVIFAFHGGGSDAKVFYNQLFRLVSRANKDKLILVFPQGVWRSWNGGGCCYTAVKCDIDDTGYIRELVGFLKGALKVDAKRIYGMGYSNGGYMTHRLGAELSDIFAAIHAGAAAIGGSYPGLPPFTISAVSPMPVILHMGDKDPSFDGGINGSTEGPRVGWSVPSFADSVSYWVTFNGCDKTPIEQTSGKALIRSFGNCTNNADVVGIVIKNHGHSWPHLNDTDGFDIVDAILTFFDKHPKP